MGKPFKQEITLINRTLAWANNADVQVTPNDLELLLSKPTLVVGSGGSFSVCHFFSICQQSKG